MKIPYGNGAATSKEKMKKFAAGCDSIYSICIMRFANGLIKCNLVLTHQKEKGNNLNLYDTFKLMMFFHYFFFGLGIFWPVNLLHLFPGNNSIFKCIVATLPRCYVYCKMKLGSQ